jgi:hypothetical protein
MEEPRHGAVAKLAAATAQLAARERVRERSRGDGGGAGDVARAALGAARLCLRSLEDAAVPRGTLRVAATAAHALSLLRHAALDDGAYTGDDARFEEATKACIAALLAAGDDVADRDDAVFCLHGALAHFEGAGRAADGDHLRATLAAVARLGHNARAQAACAHVLLRAALAEEDVARAAFLGEPHFGALAELCVEFNLWFGWS